MNDRSEIKYPLKGYRPIEYISLVGFGLIFIILVWAEINVLMKDGFSLRFFLRMNSFILLVMIVPVSIILLRTKYYKIVVSKEKKYAFLYILFILLTWAGAKFL